MKYQEALEIIKDELPFTSGVIEEALDLVEKCVNKQIPKKPIKAKELHIRYSMCYICPSCQRTFSGTGIASYCYHCGQALDWSDKE